jgi:hypothetical protein
MSATLDSPMECITERETALGYWWRYQHAEGEPEDTLTAAIMVAGEVAAEEARRRGKTYLVVSAPQPSAAVYVFACDHPDAAKVGINVMFEFTPAGEHIRRPATRHRSSMRSSCHTRLQLFGSLRAAPRFGADDKLHFPAWLRVPPVVRNPAASAAATLPSQYSANNSPSLKPQRSLALRTAARRSSKVPRDNCLSQSMNHSNSS